ncbi:MAG TPA: DUF503 domain-containing protein [Chloroflexota bacterium]|nr:DUF503 domain-containing protein [Chloroflexota bacterium]
MFVGFLLVQLHLPASNSLKDKRQVVKSLIARLSRQFGVSVAEVGQLDARQGTELGVAKVSNEAHHIEGVLEALVRFIEDTRPDVEITAVAREIERPFD